MSDEFLTQAHHGFQGTAQADIDTLMLAIRHLETRILDRMEELSGRVDHLEKSVKGRGRNGIGKAAARTATRGKKAARKARKRAPKT
jgi:hypothetical protein